MIAKSNTHSGDANQNHALNKRLLMYGGLAVVVATIVAIAFLAFSQNEDAQEEDVDAPKQLISEVEPAAPSKIITEEPAAPVAVEKPKLDYARLAAEGKTVITNKAGEEIVLPRSRRKERPRPAYAIFNHESENKIAALITLELGKQLFGTQIYNEKFKDDFLKSCEEPIVINEDDDEYTKALKQEMIDVKIDLRDRIRDGEDICQIMSDTRKELQRMGMVKREIERMLRDEVRENAHTDQDIEDYVSAANAMLAEKGISPIKMNPILKQSILRSVKFNPNTEK